MSVCIMKHCSYNLLHYIQKKYQSIYPYFKHNNLKPSKLFIHKKSLRTITNVYRIQNFRFDIPNTGVENKNC